MDLPKYQPSNGTEGMAFIEKWCDQCTANANDDCPILTAAMIYSTEETGYPAEWVKNEQGMPVCTAFNEGRVMKLREEKGQLRLF